ncbi:hypothetical protein ABVK25_004086 [Lepraria finkii]|uniref:EVE domain-containing protein n=1 Tax=Lepraria finkii TaxID=1340010 RepID=A0ABR4BDB1_9LECA
MAPPKRKVNAVEDAAAPPAKRRRRSTLNENSKKVIEQTAASSRPSRISLAAANTPRSLRSSTDGAITPTSTTKKGTKTPINGSATKSTTKISSAKGRKKGKKAVKATSSQGDENPVANVRYQANLSIDVPTQSGPEVAEEPEEKHPEAPSYWLMKAEPDSRVEKGKDIKFSIDDLKAATAPEGWDGVRNYVARNNMRLRMKGDMAFFYHSNCKVPGIAGIMEIVQEHSVDESAFDPEHPYYDEKSDREKPKWCLVHVEFRQKFVEIIKLKELQRNAKEGGVLENMQVLKQSRLSVSKVTKEEWIFITSLVDVEEVATDSVQHQPQIAA